MVAAVAVFQWKTAVRLCVLSAIPDSIDIVSPACDRSL